MKQNLFTTIPSNKSNRRYHVYINICVFLQFMNNGCVILVPLCAKLLSMDLNFLILYLRSRFFKFILLQTNKREPATASTESVKKTTKLRKTTINWTFTNNNNSNNYNINWNINNENSTSYCSSGTKTTTTKTTTTLLATSPTWICLIFSIKLFFIFSQPFITRVVSLINSTFS